MFNKALINILGSILITVITSINLVILARVLGPSVMGQYTYAIWIINIAVIVSTIGIPNTVHKYVPEINHKLGIMHGRFLFSILFSISIILSFLVGGIFAFIFPIFKNTVSYNLYLYIIALSIPLVVFTTLISAYFKSRMKFKFIYILNSVYTLLLFVLTLVPAIIFKSINPVMVGYLVTNIGYFIFVFIFVLKNISLEKFIYYLRKLPNYVKNEKLYKQVGFKDVFLYIFSVSFILVLDNVVWDRSELFFLKHFASDAQIAYYSIDFSIVQKIITLLPASIGGFLLSYFALFNIKHSDKQMQRVLYNSCKLLILFSVPIAVCGSALANPFIKYIFGSNYTGAIGTLRVIFFFGFWGPICNPILYLLYGLKKTKVILFFGLIFSLITIILDYFLVKWYSSIGAAFANGLVQMSFCITVISYAYFKLNKKYPLFVFMKSFFASSIVAFLIFLFVSNFQSLAILIFSIIIGSILYFYLIIQMKVFEKEDFVYINKFIPNKAIQNIIVKLFRMGYLE